MKKLVQGILALVASFCVSVHAQQHGQPCGGPAPSQPGINEGGSVRLTAVEAWAEAIAHWVPCSQAGMAPGGVISAYALGFKPLKAARRNFDQGMRAAQKGLNTEALEYFREAARMDPGYVQPLVQAGILQARSEQPVLALESFLRALVLEPDADYLEFNAAIILVTLDRPAEAEAFARRVTRRSPSFVEAQYVLGLALAMQGKLGPEAVAALRTVGAQRGPAREVLAWVEWKLSAVRVSAP